MESYGEILRKKREEKSLEFETISKETKLPTSFLKALETEETSVFPGETYLIGYLTTYSDYLGCDTQKLIHLYHSKVLQESPVPEGLIVRERPKFLIPLIVFFSVLIVASLFCGGYFFFKQKIDEKKEIEKLENNDKFKKYELNEKGFSGRLFVGDQLILGTEAGNVVLTTAVTNGILGIETPIGIQMIQLSEELELDVDGNSIPEIIIYVSDVSNSDKVDQGAEVKILLKSQSNAAISETKLSEIVNAADLPKDKPFTVILEDVRAYPFTLRSDFRAGCVFRYRIDRKEAVEDYYTNGDTLNMTASNGVRLWISNGNTVKMQVIANSKTYDLGVLKSGQIVVQDIRWIKDTDGKYKLVINEID